MNSTTTDVELIHADHTTAKRLGNWTTSGRFHVRARSASVLLDLRSEEIPADVEVRVDLDRGALKLLLPADVSVDHCGLDWTGKGRIKDMEGAAGNAGRVVRIVGTAANSEIRINRGGVAQLFAMCTREGFAELRRAHKAGEQPTILS